MMGWVDKTPHVRRRATFFCDSCGNRFQWREEADPEACPLCGVGATPEYQPPLPAMRTNAHRAGEFVAKMAEEDYGLTDMNDNLRQGDVSYKAPSAPTTAEASQVVQAMAEFAQQTRADLPAPLPAPLAKQADGFWQGSSPINASIAAQGSAEARAMGADPLDVIRKAPPMKLDIHGVHKG